MNSTAVRLKSIELHWVQETLIPFLRHGWAHELAFNEDLTIRIKKANDFALHKPACPTDGDDLIFERIFQAIMHRHLNVAPDLPIVGNLDAVARFLIRRAMLKGPFELLDRSEVACGEWGRNEEARKAFCENQTRVIESKGSSEDEDGRHRNVRSSMPLDPVQRPPSPSMFQPTEDVIDSRLLDAQPGEFVGPEQPLSISFEQDQAYRGSHKMHKNFLSASQVHHTWDQEFRCGTKPMYSHMLENYVPERGAKYGSGFACYFPYHSHPQQGQQHQSVYNLRRRNVQTNPISLYPQHPGQQYLVRCPTPIAVPVSQPKRSVDDPEWLTVTQKRGRGREMKSDGAGAFKHQTPQQTGSAHFQLPHPPDRGGQQRIPFQNHPCFSNITVSFAKANYNTLV